MVAARITCQDFLHEMEEAILPENEPAILFLIYIVKPTFALRKPYFLFKLDSVCL